MRCQFCGWDNPQGKDKCEKCNKPLVSESNESKSRPAENSCADNHSRPTERQAANGFDLKKTVREGTVFVATPEECPKCGYKLEHGSCPCCGYPNSEQSSQPSEPTPVSEEIDKNSEVRKTIRPSRKEEMKYSFTLTPISEQNYQPEGEAIPFEGNCVSLNRENTAPENSTITSQEQACITFADGKWGIVDSSEFKTTFVQAARRIELQSGDLILLGNQLYCFDS